MSKEIKKKLDKYHYHEFLERACLMGKMVEMLGEHSVLKKHKPLKQQLNKILEECTELYQRAGNIDDLINNEKE